METNTSDQPKHIATEVTQALSRLRERALNDSEHPRAESSSLQIGDQLLKRGFPKRHVLRLSEGLHGAGLSKAQELLPRIMRGDYLLLLIGDRGPGKTQMATWWAAGRIKAGMFAGYYRKTADLISEIKCTWNDGGKTVGTEDDVLKKYCKTQFLVLDEFHERGGSDWEARTLLNIIDHRYDNMLGTVLIANLTEAQVREQINPSIVSRAEETGGLLVCDWPSYRAAEHATPKTT